MKKNPVIFQNFEKKKSHETILEIFFSQRKRKYFLTGFFLHERSARVDIKNEQKLCKTPSERGEPSIQFSVPYIRHPGGKGLIKKQFIPILNEFDLKNW